MKQVRKAVGMSLTEVAEGSGLLRQAVARAERPGIDPRISTVLAIAKALGVPVCELVTKDAKHERHGRKRPEKQ